MAIMLKLIVFLALFCESLQWCLLKTYYELAGSRINEVDWSPDGNFIVTGSGSKRVTVISFATSNVVFF
jgi:WD40 repeat protein